MVLVVGIVVLDEDGTLEVVVVIGVVVEEVVELGVVVEDVVDGEVEEV